MKSKTWWVFIAIAIVVSIVSGWKASYESELRFRESEDIRSALGAILDSVEFGYAIVDQHFRVVEWNPAIERMSHWTKDEVQTNGLSSVFQANLMTEITSTLFDPDSTKKVLVVKYPLTTKEGDVVPVRITVRSVLTRDRGMFYILHIDRSEETKILTMKEGQEQVIPVRALTKKGG